MDKREKIIRTAMKLFVRQGFEHTPTSQISEEADVATGTLFHHFRTKEDLINEAYLYVKHRMISAIRVENDLAVREKLRQSWNAMFQHGSGHKVETEFMIMFSGSKHITKQAQKLGREIFEPFTDIIKQGKEEGLFKDLPQAVLENAYFTLGKSMMCTKMDSVLIDKGFAMVWDALKK